MQRVPRQKQRAFQFRRPPLFDEAKIKCFVVAINFIAHNRMTERSKMNANLMRAAGSRNSANDAETITCTGITPESLRNDKFRARGCTFRVNRLLQPNW